MIYFASRNAEDRASFFEPEYDSHEFHDNIDIDDMHSSGKSVLDPKDLLAQIQPHKHATQRQHHDAKTISTPLWNNNKPSTSILFRINVPKLQPSNPLSN